MAHSGVKDRFGHLKLPEILLGVLRHVDNPATLVSCACVNRLWFQESIRWLWRGSPLTRDDKWKTPDIRWLCRIARESPERLHDYVRRVSHLRIQHGRFRASWEEMLPLWQLTIWNDARLLTIDVDLGSGHTRAENLKVLLGQDLRVWKHSYGSFRGELLESLQVRFEIMTILVSRCLLCDFTTL